ncbi:MAG: hypothetical protein IPK58_06175 [Acidobacteria bacterium]|nr:hypothetical protein [Acidobacteriota bacterium]
MPPRAMRFGEMIENKDKRKVFGGIKKMKFLVVLSLFASMLLAGCGGGAANNANANAKTRAHRRRLPIWRAEMIRP